MIEKTKLTKDGYKQLENELRELIDVTREDIKKQLEEARAQGDLSENADYTASRARLAEVEGRISQIEEILSNAEIISESSKNASKIALGSTVAVRYLETGKEFTYKIVGTIESDPFAGKISNASPLGEALIGKSVNDIIEIKGKNTYRVQVLKIELK